MRHNCTFSGRSLSALASSQIVLNPDIPEAHHLRGWYDNEGHSANFTEYQRDGASAGGGFSPNWKTFKEVKESGPQGDHAMYYSTKATVMFFKKDNCMYQVLFLLKWNNFQFIICYTILYLLSGHYIVKIFCVSL